MQEKNVSILTNVAWKFAERITSQSITLLVSILLARMLDPNDHGAIGIVMIFITIANEFVVSGIPTALIQKKDADELDFSSVFYFNLLVSIVLYFIVFFTAGSIAKFYKIDILASILRVLGIRIIIASINSVQHSYVARKMMFKKYFLSTLFGSVVSGFVGVLMAYLGYGVWSLVAQYMVNTTVDTIVLLVTVDWRPKLQFSFKRVRNLFAFGWRILFEGLSNTLNGQLSNSLIGKVYTPSDLAFYTKGQQFPSLIVNNISATISSVLFPAISNEQDDKEKVLYLLRKSVSISTYIVYPMLVGLALVAKPFIKVVLTKKWIETTPYLVSFCLLNLPTVGMIPRHQALNGIGRSDVYMNEHVIARIVSIIMLFLTYKISVLAILLGGVLSTIVLVLIIAFTSKKYNGYSYKDQIKDICPAIIGCLLMSITVKAVELMNINDLFLLATQIVVGITTYICYSIIFNVSEYYVCIDMLEYFYNRIFKHRRNNTI